MTIQILTGVIEMEDAHIAFVGELQIQKQLEVSGNQTATDL